MDGTGDGNRPLSSERDGPGDLGDKTDLQRTGFGNLFVDIVFSSGPDGTGYGNRPLSSEQDGPGVPGDKIDSYWTECGDLFASIVSASRPSGTDDNCR